MTDPAEVRTRRLTAVLEEVVGGGCPPELVERVRQRLGEVPTPRPRWRGGTLLAALCMLGGIAVVVATARWSGSARTAAAPGSVAQEPAPEGAAAVVTITTAMVRAAAAPIEPPPPGDGVTRLLALVQRDTPALVVAPGVQGESKVELAGLTWHEAVVHIAAELGVGVATYGSVVVVGLGPPAVSAASRCTLRTRAPDVVRELPKLLHAATGLDLVVAADVAGRFGLDVDDVPVHALLDVLAARLALQVVGCGDVLALRRAAAEGPPSRLALNFRGRPVTAVFDAWAKIAGRNFVIDAGLSGVVSVRTFRPVEADLETALAAAVGADVERADRGIVRFVPRLTLPESVTLTAERLVVMDVASSVGVADELVAVAATGPSRPAAVVVARARAVDVLRALAVATDRQLLRRERRYVIE